MKTLLLLAALAVPLAANSPVASPKLEDLAWMTGHWSATIDGWAMEEIWLAPAGGMMLGMHRDVKGAKSSFEFIRIASTPDGIAYLAQPGGRPVTAFTLIEATPTRAVFANPKNEFPQRITYTLVDGRLCARVEGGNEKAQAWCWTRR